MDSVCMLNAYRHNITFILKKLCYAYACAQLQWCKSCIKNRFAQPTGRFMPLRTAHLIHNQVVAVVIRCVAPLSGNLPCSETLTTCSPKNSYGSLRSFHVAPLAAKTPHQWATSIAFIYNTFVGPVLLYNAGSWGLKVSETDKLDVFHQK